MTGGESPGGERIYSGAALDDGPPGVILKDDVREVGC